MDEMRYYNSPITLEEAEQYIQSGLITAARAYVANGYYLHRIREDKLFEEAGYQNFEDYVRGKYNKDKGWASKCIKVNQQLSEGGDSPILSKQYLEYSTYQLVELAYMTEEQREEAAPDMTVNQLKQIRKPEEAVEPEKSCDITTSEPGEREQDPEEAQESGVYHFLDKHESIDDAYGWIWSEMVKQYLKNGYKSPDKEYEAVVFGNAHKVLKRENVTVFHDISGAALFNVENARLEREYNFFFGKQEVEPIQDQAEQPEENQENGTFNSEPTACLYREGYSCTLSEEKKKVPGDGYSCGFTCCWSCKFQGMCKMECNASAGRAGEFPEYDSAWAVKAWAEISACSGDLKKVLKACRENPINADRAKAVQKAVSPNGAYNRGCWEYSLSFHSFAGGIDFRIGKVDIHLKYGRFVQELMNLYPDFEEAASKDPEIVIKEPESVPEQPESVPEQAENVSEQAENVSDSTENIIDGEFVEVLPEPEPELEKQEQPELPLLKNNDQRKEFIDAYEAWPVWIDQKETGERYYRYDLSHKVAMVVKVSWKHSWGNYKESKDYEYGAEQYYLLGVKSEWSANARSVYVEDETRTFYECSTNMTALVDYLKEFQKKK